MSPSASAADTRPRWRSEGGIPGRVPGPDAVVRDREKHPLAVLPQYDADDAGQASRERVLKGVRHQFEGHDADRPRGLLVGGHIIQCQRDVDSEPSRLGKRGRPAQRLQALRQRAVTTLPIEKLMHVPEAFQPNHRFFDETQRLRRGQLALGEPQGRQRNPQFVADAMI
jgi:hypothetical protein